MSTEKLHNVDKILDRVKGHYGLPSDAKLAEFLDVKPGTISAWRSRNSMDYPLVLAKCREVNANWILYGEGPESKNLSLAAEPSEPYDEKSMTERIQDLDLPPKEKLELLKAYVNVLEELKTTEPDEYE